MGFKDFITRGNIIDLAIGVLIGGAFGKIVTSLVNDVIMPPIGILLGNADFTSLSIVLKDAVYTADGETILTPAVVIAYGKFIQTTVEFLIIAFVIYTVVNVIIRRRQFLEKLEQQVAVEPVEEPKEEVVPEDILLLREIRDELKKK
ncbi:MAG TPA: large-conductance mechanosensitive channel protein MscL [Acholeplasma sp.]|nr:large-conductance mechanosensitive channel protein MscL [Acholeplasma sp.]